MRLPIIAKCECEGIIYMHKIPTFQIHKVNLITIYPSN